MAVILYLFFFAVSILALAPLEVHDIHVDRNVNGELQRRYIILLKSSFPRFDRNEDKLKHYITTEIPSIRLEDLERVYDFGNFRGFSCWLNSGALQNLREYSEILLVEEDSIATSQPVSTENLKAITPMTDPTWLDRADWGQIRADENPNNLQTVPAGLYSGGNYADPFSTNWTWAGQKFSPPNLGDAANMWILDTGVFPNHQEFNAGGSTRVIQLVNFAGGDPGQQGDCNGHGTHVAGSCCGAYRGIASGSIIRSVRVLDCTGQGYNTDVISGVNYVAQNLISGRPNIIVASLTTAPSTTVDSAFNSAVDLNIVCVVTSGTSDIGKDACSNSTGVSPAKASKVFAVAATDAYDYIAYFSNYGSCLEGFAPGFMITSAWIDPNGRGGVSYYNDVNGISMPAIFAGSIAVYTTMSGSDYTPNGVLTAINTLLPRSIVKGLTSAKSNTPNIFIFDKWGHS